MIMTDYLGELQRIAPVLSAGTGSGPRVPRVPIKMKIWSRLFRFSTAHSFSYQGNYLDGRGNGFTRGIFQQSVGQGSFNGHVHGRKRRRGRRSLRSAVVSDWDGNVLGTSASGSDPTSRGTTESVPCNVTAL